MPLPDGLRHSRILRQEPVPLTVDGLRFAIFYTKLHESTAAPTARDQSPAPPRSRKELRTNDNHTNESLNRARFLPDAT